MEIHFEINHQLQTTEAAPGDSLLKVLRRLGYLGVKHGCESGECGACTVLLDGKPVNSCVLLAAQASGRRIETIESVGEHPEQGWRLTDGLHPLQKALSRAAPYSVDIAPQPKFLQPGTCWSATRIRAKLKYAMPSPGCFAAAQAT
jgi:aerobic-type carbon monoxide dehydrogenase small subunit (CoxS/CutS family)